MVAVAERLDAQTDEPGEVDESVLPRRLLWAATAIFFVVLTALILYRHGHIGTRAFDLGIFDQGLWLLSEGETPFVTVRGLHLFADHSSFLMIPLVPLYWIWSDVRVLLMLTAFAMAAGGPLVYKAARAEGVATWPAAALGLSYLLLPAVQWQVWDAFHPETLAVPLLLAAYLLALRRHWAWALVFLALVLLAKEDAALVVVPLALYLGIRFRQRWLAIGGVTLGITALLLNFGVLLPHWSPTGELIYAGRYPAFGDSLTSIASGVITSPGEVITTALGEGRWVYLVGMILPMILALAAPEVLIVAVPTYLANVLSIHYYQSQVEYHYTAYIISVVAIAAIVGTRRLLRWSRGRQRAVRWRNSLVAIGLIAAFTGSIVGGPWPTFRNNPWAGHAPDSALVTEALAVVPADAAVAADFRLVPHLTHRLTVYEFPNPVVTRNWSVNGMNPPPPDDFDWIIVRANLAGMDELFTDELDKLTSTGEFVAVVENVEVTVWQRASSQ